MGRHHHGPDCRVVVVSSPIGGALSRFANHAYGVAFLLTLVLLVGWTALDASVGLQMIKGKSWARGVFIVGFPTLWALTASSFSSAALEASVACWVLGMVVLTRPSAMAYFGEA